MSFQIALVGDPEVGKTQIIRYLQGEEFQEEYIPTEDIQTHEITIQASADVTVMDTPGNYDDRKKVVEALREVNTVFVCFDVSNTDSFDSSTQWLDDIQKQIKAQLNVYLVACKCDISDRAITSDQAMEFIANYSNVEYLEVSSLTGSNMEQLADRMQQPAPLTEKSVAQLKQHTQSQASVKSQEQQLNKQLSMITKEEPLWKAFDFLFPSGRVAKLIKISDITVKNLPIQDMLFKLQLNQSYPVVNLIGAKETNRGKFYAGVARACFNTDAIIVDSAITTGLEKYVIRRGVKLIGVAPESEIKYPNTVNNFTDPYEISNGHTQIFLVNNREKSMFFGMEATFKINLCNKLAEGKLQKNGQRENMRVVHILLGEQEGFINELQLAVNCNQPIIVIKGSPLCDEYFQNYSNPKAVYSDPSTFGNIVKKGHFYALNSLDSEDIAQYVHFLLTVTPFV